jgi:hypothetical protein
VSINRNTLKPEPEIGTDRSRKTWQNLPDDGYGAGFGLPNAAGGVFGQIRNRTELF